MEIKDPDLRNTVWELGQGVKKKEAKKNWQPPPRDPHEHYRGHSEKQVIAAKKLADRIQGERDG